MEFPHLYMMYGNWLKESHFEVKCHDFDRLVLDTKRLSLHTLFDWENDVKRYHGETFRGHVLSSADDSLVL